MRIVRIVEVAWLGDRRAYKGIESGWIYCCLESRDSVVHMVVKHCMIFV